MIMSYNLTLLCISTSHHCLLLRLNVITSGMIRRVCGWIFTSVCVFLPSTERGTVGNHMDTQWAPVSWKLHCPGQAAAKEINISSLFLQMLKSRKEIYTHSHKNTLISSSGLNRCWWKLTHKQSHKHNTCVSPWMRQCLLPLWLSDTKSSQEENKGKKMRVRKEWN